LKFKKYEQLPSIDEEQSQQIDEDLELEEQPTIAITKPKRETKQPQLFLNRTRRKKTTSKKESENCSFTKRRKF
jgi:hypothetical protein